MTTKRKSTRKRGERGPDKSPRKKRTDGKTPPSQKGKKRNNPLPRGTIKAIRATKLRVPEGASDEHSDLAEEAFQGIVGVMRGDTTYIEHIPVHDRLRAMTIVREEVCGPIPKEHKVKGSMNLIIETGVPRTPGQDDE